MREDVRPLPYEGECKNMMEIPTKQFTETTIEELIIPSEKIAHVQIGNPLEHALLVLVKSGYSAVPVLNPSYKLEGIISKTIILEEVLGMERFEMERLSEIKVDAIMKKDIPTLKKYDTLSLGLKKTIDHPFVCVVDEEKQFDGLLTRRAILKKINRMLHADK